MAALAIALWILWGKYQGERIERIRQTNNVAELQREHSEVTKELQFDKKQMESRLKQEYQEILDSLGKKPKEITKFHYIKTVREVHDTVKILKVKHDTVYYNKAVYSDCGLSVTASWRQGDSVATFDIKDTSEFAITTYKSHPWWRFWNKEWETQVINTTCEKVIANERLTKIKRKKK